MLRGKLSIAFTQAHSETMSVTIPVFRLISTMLFVVSLNVKYAIKARSVVATTTMKYAELRIELN